MIKPNPLRGRVYYVSSISISTHYLVRSGIYSNPADRIMTSFCLLSIHHLCTLGEKTLEYPHLTPYHNSKEIYI